MAAPARLGAGRREATPLAPSSRRGTPGGAPAARRTCATTSARGTGSSAQASLEAWGGTARGRPWRVTGPGSRQSAARGRGSCEHTPVQSSSYATQPRRQGRPSILPRGARLVCWEDGLPEGHHAWERCRERVPFFRRHGCLKNRAERARGETRHGAVPAG